MTSTRFQGIKGYQRTLIDGIFYFYIFHLSKNKSRSDYNLKYNSKRTPITTIHYEYLYFCIFTF